MRTHRSPPLPEGRRPPPEGGGLAAAPQSLLRKEEPEPSLPATAPSVTHVSFKNI